MVWLCKKNLCLRVTGFILFKIESLVAMDEATQTFLTAVGDYGANHLCPIVNKPPLSFGCSSNRNTVITPTVIPPWKHTHSPLHCESMPFQINQNCCHCQVFSLYAAPHPSSVFAVMTVLSCIQLLTLRKTQSGGILLFK